MIENKFKSNLDLADLLSRSWQLNYWIDGSGVEMSYRQSSQTGLEQGLFKDAALEITNILNDHHKPLSLANYYKPCYLMVNRLPPGIKVPKHTDTLKNDNSDYRIKRYHLPLSTNEECYFWEESMELINNGIGIHLPLGYWYGPIEYWKEHSIANHGKTTRVHLVIDLNCLRNYD